MSFSCFSSHLGKKGWEQFSAEKNWTIYGRNRFRNINNMAGTHFSIGIGNQIGKIGSKKGPESGIPNQASFFTMAMSSSSTNVRTPSLSNNCSPKPRFDTFHPSRQLLLLKVIKFWPLNAPLFTPPLGPLPSRLLDPSSPVTLPLVSGILGAVPRPLQ